MLLKLLLPLERTLSFFNVFHYITFRASYAAITALLIAFLFGPWVIERLRALKARQVVRADGPQSHRGKSGTPTMGGVLIILSVVISTLLWQDLESPHTWLLLATLVAYGTIGFTDDLLKVLRRDSGGLPAPAKLGAQLVLALLIGVALTAQRTESTTLLYLPFFKTPVADLGWLYVPLSVLLLAGYSNAVNFTDGLDGLATGLVIFVAATFAVLAYITGRVDWTQFLQIPYVEGAGEIMVFCLALLGALVGFLWFNAHPAEVWMGDTGSLALGGVLGVVAMIIKKEVLLFIVGGVFVIEIASVVLQVAHFKLTGRRVFRMAPIHHHFELAGWHESKVVIRFWILGGLFALVGLSTLKIQ
jgi:phospho-N-acetylmuramoyl-pentapeptide-transferase